MRPEQGRCYPWTRDIPGEGTGSEYIGIWFTENLGKMVRFAQRRKCLDVGFVFYFPSVVDIICFDHICSIKDN